MSLLDQGRLDVIVSCLKDIDAKKVEGNVVEVGVYQGGSLNIICQNTKRKVFGIDTFEGMPDVGSLDKHKKGDFNVNYDNVKQTLVAHKHLELLKGLYPDSFRDFKAYYPIALLHLDVDIYDSVKESLEHIWAHVNVGGYVIIDDYAARGCPGAKIAANEFIGKCASDVLIVGTSSCQLTLKKTAKNAPGSW